MSLGLCLQSERSAGTRSHRMKFCVQGGLGALPSTSKQSENPGRDFPLWGRCVLTPALLAKFIAYDKLVITSMLMRILNIGAELLRPLCVTPYYEQIFIRTFCRCIPAFSRILSSCSDKNFVPITISTPPAFAPYRLSNIRYNNGISNQGGLPL